MYIDPLEWFFAKENKRAEYFAQWVEERIEEAFIRVRLDFDFCPDLVKYMEGSDVIRP